MSEQSKPAKKIAMLFIAVIVWFGLVAQAILILQTTTSTGYSTPKTIINFFSYFTILSNLFIAICFTACLFSSNISSSTFWGKTTVQSGITLYIFIVGLVYNLVLRGIVTLTGFHWVVDNILHVVVPLLFVIYWFVFTPKKSLLWKTILPWLIFPSIYLAYSLLRGLQTNWYPYPFLNIEKLGTAQVILNSFFVMLAFILIGLGLIAYNRNVKTTES